MNSRFALFSIYCLLDLRLFIRLSCLLAVAIPAILSAEDLSTAADMFSSGSVLYHEGEFIEAMPFLKKATELAPSNSSYQHMLGKCYGRIAEHGSWLTALRFVNKTRHQFELAVKLDESNYPAWRDLEEFYRRAPAFFGGNEKRAQEIRLMLEKEGKRQSSSSDLRDEDITTQ